MAIFEQLSLLLRPIALHSETEMHTIGSCFASCNLDVIPRYAIERPFLRQASAPHLLSRLPTIFSCRVTPLLNRLQGFDVATKLI